MRKFGLTIAGIAATAAIAVGAVIVMGIAIGNLDFDLDDIDWG